MVLKGDTVRFEVNFVGFDNTELVDIEPSEVTFKLYSVDEAEVFTKELTAGHRITNNHYFYDHLIPTNYSGTYYYEFKGTFNNKPYVARDDFNVTFE